MPLKSKSALLKIKIKFNVIGELRAVIAVSVLDSISQQSMTVKKQHDTVSAMVLKNLGIY
jgi:hypothetical protein